MLESAVLISAGREVDSNQLAEGSNSEGEDSDEDGDDLDDVSVTKLNAAKVSSLTSRNRNQER